MHHNTASAAKGIAKIVWLNRTISRYVRHLEVDLGGSVLNGETALIRGELRIQSSKKAKQNNQTGFVDINVDCEPFFDRSKPNAGRIASDFGCKSDLHRLRFVADAIEDR